MKNDQHKEARVNINRLSSRLISPPTLALGAALCALIYVSLVNIKPLVLANKTPQPAQGLELSVEKNSDISAIPQYPIEQIPGWHLFGKTKKPVKAVEQPIITAPKTRLDLTLHGIIFATKESEGLAIISSSSEDEQKYAIGNMIPGGAILHQVEKERIILKRNGHYESLSMNTDGLALGKSSDKDKQQQTARE
ncbi:MAG: type II secretion system protein N [Candidatus Sedimenticola endophacoides]